VSGDETIGSQTLLVGGAKEGERKDLINN